MQLGEAEPRGAGTVHRQQWQRNRDRGRAQGQECPGAAQKDVVQTQAGAGNTLGATESEEGRQTPA